MTFLAGGHFWASGLMFGMSLTRLIVAIDNAFRLARLWPLLNQLVDRQQLQAARNQMPAGASSA